MSFSQRIGKKQVRTFLQKDSIDDILKNKLWNVFYNEFYSFFSENYRTSLTEFSKDTNNNFLNKRSNYHVSYQNTYKIDIQNWFFLEAKWFEIYDFIEKICDYTYYWNLEVGYEIQPKFIEKINKVLETELSAYRIVDYQVVPISDDVEIKSIEEALETNNKFKNVAVHLDSALAYLSNRKAPDYRNSIKESISAVEIICRIITGESTLGKAINKLEKSGIILHQNLKTAFEKLYAYTNDSKTGIRHALIEDGHVITFDEAKFMLVSCSSFINYIKSKTL